MKIIKRLGIAVLTVFTITSCSDSFFDVNESVNSPSFSIPELTLPAAQKASTDLLEGDYNSYNTLGNLFTNVWAAAGDAVYFTDETSYNVTNGFRPATFTRTYLNVLANYDYVEKNTDPKYINYVAIAKIMKAFHFQYLVDIYGDVPYTEAFQRELNPTPAYDKAEDIYADLLVQLTAAQALIDSAGPEALLVGSKDIMCGGDMAKWKKFANTIKLRIVLRAAGLNGTPDFTSVTNGIGFLAAGETVYCNPGFVPLVVDKQNVFYNEFKLNASNSAGPNAAATRMTPFADQIIAGSDARKPLLWNKVGTTYATILQNRVGGTASGALSSIGNGVLKGADMPGIIMQSAESLLLQAEAAERGFTGTPITLYNAAIQESYNQLGAGTSAGIYNYPTSGTYTDKMNAIYLQKLIALMSTNGIENWIEARRFNYAIPVADKLVSGVAVPVATNIPVRLLYPFSELSTNSENVPVQVEDDAFNTKIFWDIN